MNVLVFNPGSSTLKFGLYETSDAAVKEIVGGVIDRIGSAQAQLKVSAKEQRDIVETVSTKSLADGVDEIIARLPFYPAAHAALKIDAVGCRIVHGGARFVQPTRINETVLSELRALTDLAPLHNPAGVATLERVMRSLPDTPLIAVFDTAFHRTIPEVASTYALPTELNAREGLRRYGFHGISHAYVSRQVQASRVITCHLGNGASMCAVKDGVSVDTSMGFTPLEGLVMGTRAGDVDAGIILHLLRKAGVTLDDVDRVLNHESGLLGLSGLTSDVRDLERAAAEGNKNAELALDVFAYRVRKYIGAYAAALGGLDALAFTGGIGEHSDEMRGRICKGMDFLGIHLDEASNKNANGRTAQINAMDGAVKIWVIPTDEEREIAMAVSEVVR